MSSRHEPGAGHRPPVQRGRVDVGELRPREVAGAAGVAERGLGKLALGEVRGELGRDRVRVVAGAALDGERERPVEVVAARVRQPLVRGIADEVVAEPDERRALPGHELVEPVPQPEVAGVPGVGFVRDGLGEQVHVHDPAEDRGAPEQAPAARVEAVDPARDQGLETLRELVDRARR